ncbi:MAG: DUF2568 domain-containing protein [Rhizobiaceae bacterium]
MNATNLALRFLLELAALSGLAVGASGLADGLSRYSLAVLAVGVAATLWGVFAVPGDPSRSGRAPVPVPGAVRLVLELVVLLGGAGGWHLGGFTLVAGVLAALVIAHYLMSRERILWLLRQ